MTRARYSCLRVRLVLVFYQLANTNPIISRGGRPPRARRNQGNRASLILRANPPVARAATSAQEVVRSRTHARRGVVSRDVCPPRDRGTTRISAARRGGSPAPNTTFRDPSQRRCRCPVRRRQHESVAENEGHALASTRDAKRPCARDATRHGRGAAS